MGATVEGKRYKYSVWLSVHVEGEGITVEEAYTALRYSMSSDKAEPVVTVFGKEAKVTMAELRVSRAQLYSDEPSQMAAEQLAW